MQLIKSILFAIQSYWSAHFLLPKAVIKRIDQLLFRFLWKGSSLDKYGTKVARENVTLPFFEGGLGLKKIVELNSSQILFILWQIISFNSSSFWAEWVRKTVLLKHNFWTTCIPSDASWIWKKVLNLRTMAARFISYKVGNGCLINLWHDPWLGGQPLAWQHTDSIVSHSRLPYSAKVSAIIQNDCWNPPLSTHSSILNMKEDFRSAPLPSNAQDQILWAGSSQVKAALIWQSIHHSKPPVIWQNLVWHKTYIPRFSFFLWLAMHKRLPTWQMNICCLCEHSVESFHHLFFDRSFSRLLLCTVFAFHGRFGVPTERDQLLRLIQFTRMYQMTFNIIKLCLETMVYKIWNERNRRAHAEHSSTAAILAQECNRLVKCNLFL